MSALITIISFIKMNTQNNIQSTTADSIIPMTEANKEI